MLSVSGQGKNKEGQGQGSGEVCLFSILVVIFPVQTKLSYFKILSLNLVSQFIKGSGKIFTTCDSVHKFVITQITTYRYPGDNRFPFIAAETSTR